MNHHPAAWGQPLTAHQQFDMYSTFPIGHTGAAAAPVTHTQQPLVTGTSVIGLKYADGVMLAADNLASYGSLARFRDIQRLHPLGTHTILGAAGDMSDFQWLKKELDALLRDEEALKLTDGHPPLAPRNLYTFLANLFYSRRSRINPLWNACLVGGWDFEKDEPFLGYVDLLGTTYTAPTLATGFGMHLAQPLLREKFEAKAGVDGKGPLLSAEEAEAALDECMKVLFYRDARSINKYQIAKVTKDGVTISDSKTAPTVWDFAEGLRGYGAQVQ
ncbi:endopeptidase [Cutaneotrichosporon oleaginosum]|uniref:Proteasome subunit beta n=2 Tax=Cutaneotrichosporon oleaginosum TaxID=879819 RepID=A0A0J0XM41_9TREE|nr:endopeptidase [Cutaneotrichosporon oleaginosum]KLT42182.1 endopeptidase [Cutaneotrichosporon oleaginosum]